MQEKKLLTQDCQSGVINVAQRIASVLHAVLEYSLGDSSVASNVMGLIFLF